jgi:hypothetical protein
MQMTGETGVAADLTLMLRNAGERRGSTPKGPYEPHKHQATEDQENSPENPPAGSFARHMIMHTYR